MTNNENTLLSAIQWPEPRPDLQARIIAATTPAQNISCDFCVLSAPRIHWMLGIGMTVSLMAGLLVGPSILETSTSTPSILWVGAGVNFLTMTSL